MGSTSARSTTRHPSGVVAGEAAAGFAAPDKLLSIRQGALHAYTFDRRLGHGAGGTHASSPRGSAAPPPSRCSAPPTRASLRIARNSAAPATGMGEPAGIPSFARSASRKRITSHRRSCSADEQSVVVFRQPTGDNDVWVIELRLATSGERITDGQPADAHPLWDPDGQHVVFQLAAIRPSGPARQAVNGGRPNALQRGRDRLAVSWTRNRRIVLLRRETRGAARNLVAVGAAGEPGRGRGPVARRRDGRAVLPRRTNGSRSRRTTAAAPRCSCRRSRRRGRTQVSTTGGTQVRWSADGERSLRGARQRMMAVRLVVGSTTPEAELPVPLFQTHLATRRTALLGLQAAGARRRRAGWTLPAEHRHRERQGSPIVVSVNWMSTLAK